MANSHNWNSADEPYIIGFDPASRTSGLAVLQAGQIVDMRVLKYKQKDSQVFDTTSFVDGGVLVIPEGIPRYVADFLKARARIGVGTVA